MTNPTDEERCATHRQLMEKMGAVYDEALVKTGNDCRSCSKDYDDHTFFVTEDIEILRSQGCSVTLCDDDMPDKHLDSAGIHWGYVLSPDGTALQTNEIHARCKAPGNPCDHEHMRKISS